jgi:hypothetical protein
LTILDFELVQVKWTCPQDQSIEALAGYETFLTKVRSGRSVRIVSGLQL